MKYQLTYTERSVRDIQKLDSSIKQRIAKSLVRYQTDPIKFSRKLTNPALGSYRFRIGDYRVIFDIEGKDLVILRVGHRRDIYKK